MDNRLYEFNRRIGKHTTQLEGQIVEPVKVLTREQKLLRQKMQGTGVSIPF
jgi:hypothetical protein